MSLVSLFWVAECMIVTRDRFWTSQMSSLMINLKFVMLTTVRFRSYKSVSEFFLFNTSDVTSLDASESGEAFCWQIALLWEESERSLMVPSSFTISSTFPSPEGLPGAQCVKVNGLQSVQLHCPAESWVPPIKALELISETTKLLVFWSGTDARSPLSPRLLQWVLASFQELNGSLIYL